MPLIVDKEERRAQVISVAFDLVANQGIEALTFREIAAATGCSTSIVSHYFHNKNDLLFCVYQLANERARERLDHAFASKQPLLTCFDSILPVSDEPRRNWRVWLAFWGRAHLEPTYLNERRRAAEDSLALYRAMLSERMSTRLDDEAMDLAARRFIACVAGIGLEASFAPDDWTTARMHAVLTAQLAELGLGPDD